MELNTEADLRQLCRICAIDVDDDTTSHLLIGSDGATALGDKFMSCLGIQVKQFSLFISEIQI